MWMHCSLGGVEDGNAVNPLLEQGYTRYQALASVVVGNVH